ncbi:MAG: hypothetical protein M3Q94_21560 [Pseudomonadota bacterium]|nr:hypothetical protein [Pseudomonadota bacterium]
MTGFKNLLLAFTVLSASTAAFASDDSLPTLPPGKSGEKAKKSAAWSTQLPGANPWATYSAGYPNVSVSHNGIKLRETELLGRYDLS